MLLYLFYSIIKQKKVEKMSDTKKATDISNFSEGEKIIFKGLEQIYKKVAEQDKKITALQAQNKELQEYIQTNLSPQKIDDIVCKSIAKTTFTGKNHENVVKMLAENFTGISIYFREVRELIKTSADRTISETSSIIQSSSSSSLF